MSQDKSELTVEEAKRQIIQAAVESENHIVVRHRGGLSVSIPGKTFQGLDAYFAKDAINELVEAGDALEVPFGGDKAGAYKISQSLLNRATKDTSE